MKSGRLLRRWEDIQEARPGPLTDEEYAAMLRGEGVNPARSENVQAKRSGAVWRVQAVTVLPDYCLRVVFNGVSSVVIVVVLPVGELLGPFAGVAISVGIGPFP